VQRQQVDAAAGARAEALAQARRELRERPLELLREPDEPPEVGLARLLAVAELVRRARQPALRPRRAADGGRDVGRVAVAEQLEQLPRRVAVEQ